MTSVLVAGAVVAAVAEAVVMVVAARVGVASVAVGELVAVTMAASVARPWGEGWHCWRSRRQLR